MTLASIVLGLVAPLLLAVNGKDKILLEGAFHKQEKTYDSSDPLHRFAIHFYSCTDVVLAGFLVYCLGGGGFAPNNKDGSKHSLRTAWSAIALHQWSYGLAAWTSFGFQRTMIPSFGTAAVATTLALLGAS